MLWLATRSVLSRRSFTLPWTCIRSYSQRTCPELRILFCGSDAFSGASLAALAKAKDDKRLPIKSLEVLTRPPKRTGRGLKNIREAPIVEIARRLGFPVHKIDTFKGWDLPPQSDINMVIAVSYGLLIPRRIIEAAQYGGLNVHPSLLPNFRGAAPIEHALLQGCEWTGVSLQTLHPDRFDHGAVLRQERVEIGKRPFEKGSGHSVSAIKYRLAEKGAELLVGGLETAEFLHPVRDTTQETQHGELRRAPKTTPDDEHLDWRESRAEQVLTRQWVLGPLWSTLVRTTNDGTATETRVKWTGGFTAGDDDAHSAYANAQAESRKPKFTFDSREGALHFPTTDGVISITRFTPAGRTEMTAKQAWKYLKIKDDDMIDFR